MEVVKEQKFRTYDSFGSGAFGASRGDHKHKGVDLIAEEGVYVYAPFSGKITKYGYAYYGAHYRYIEITGKEYRCRIFYAELDSAHYVGKEVPEGQFLGVAQGIENRYPGITPHVHFELYAADSTNQDDPIDPTNFLKKKDHC